MEFVKSINLHTCGDIVKSFLNRSSKLHWKHLRQTFQVLFPNTYVVQGAYDSHSKAKLPEIIKNFYLII